MSSSIITNPAHPLEWSILGWWTLTPGRAITVETTDAKDLSKAELIILTPFQDAWRPSIVLDKSHALFSTAQCTWIRSVNGALTLYYIDVLKVDNTHVKLTASANCTASTRLQLMALAPVGTY